MKNIWKQKSINESTFDYFVNSGKSPLLSRLIASRDCLINDKKDLSKFLKKDIGILDQPESVPNVNKIFDVLNKKIKSAVVFGDYDVDGTFSTFMLMGILYKYGIKNIESYIPHREEDGYGLNTVSLDRLIKSFEGKTPDILFLLDCGTNSYQEIDVVKIKFPKIKIIVIDHHIIEDKLFSKNADLVINCRLKDNVTAYSTGGLIYQLGQFMEKETGINFKGLLPYAAITTVADVSDLDMNNRVLVANGLNELHKVKNIGLQELIKISGIDAKNCSTTDISFKLAPRLNANGRIEHAKEVVNLLKCKEESKAFEMALHMNSINDERKTKQKNILNQSIKMLENFDKNSILLYNEKWDCGIVGIIASKLVEKYNVPVVLFGKSGDKIKGSARSVAGINIKEVMDMASEIFDGYGGHEMAAGASLKASMVSDAWRVFDDAVKAYKKEHEIDAGIIEYDALLPKSTFMQIDDEFCDKLDKFAPFGQGNRPFIFRVNGVTLDKIREWSSGVGAFVLIDSTKTDGFIYEENASKLSGQKLDILFQIEENFKDDQKWAIVIRYFKESKKYYAGIGSRSTPEEIKEAMTQIAKELDRNGYTLRSGGADGADTAFENGASNNKQIFLPWEKFNENSSDLFEYKKEHEEIAEKHHPRFKHLKQGAKRLMVRNTAQIVGKSLDDELSSFVVCWTSDGNDSGGTGQAIRIAKSLGIPVFNLYHDVAVTEMMKFIKSH